MRSDGTERRVAGETSPAESENPGFAPCCTQAGTTDELPSLRLRHLSDQGRVPQKGSSGRTASGLRKGLLLPQTPRTLRDAMSEEASVGPRERVRRWVGYRADSGTRLLQPRRWALRGATAGSDWRGRAHAPGWVAGQGAGRRDGDETSTLCSSLQDDSKTSQPGSGPETQPGWGARGRPGSELRVLPCT